MTNIGEKTCLLVSSLCEAAFLPNSGRRRGRLAPAAAGLVGVEASKQVHCIVDNSVSRKKTLNIMYTGGTSAALHTTSAETGSILTPYFASSLSFLRSLYPGGSMPALVSMEGCSCLTEAGKNSDSPRPSPTSAIVCSIGRLLSLRVCSLLSNSSSPSPLSAQGFLPLRLPPVYSYAVRMTDVKAPYPNTAGMRPTAMSCQPCSHAFPRLFARAWQN